jgi:DNA polymerase I-like protein with 3'-5' exonuclease and polymerase domains
VRRKNGSVTDFTRIKNYPVQGFATADVVPVILMEIERRLYEYRSCIVNTVHDSIVIDVHPDEEDAVIGIIKAVDKDLVQLVEKAYGVTINVPMKLEAKIGANWLDTKDVP